MKKNLNLTILYKATNPNATFATTYTFASAFSTQARVGFKNFSAGSTLQNTVTSRDINEMLHNQGVSITDSELDKLKNIPGVKFDLPINDQTYPSFVGLVGRPKTRGPKAGVYIFTHLATGSKYVGSSNSLSRRLDQYFSSSPLIKETGLLLPLIKKDGFSSFSLEIFVMPPELSKDYYYLFLEQYHLLYKDFDLNTQRIVNFRVNQGTTVYMYDLKGEILYYSSTSLNQLRAHLGLHHATCTKCIKEGTSYVDFFKITDKPIETAQKSEISTLELASLIAEKRALSLKSLSKITSRPLSLKDVDTGEILKFSSITSATAYLK